MSAAPTQLLVFEFGPEAVYEGHLVGALERIETGTALGIQAIVFARREPDSGELVALERRGSAAALATGPLLDFRLDPAARGRETARALSSPVGETVRTLGERLAPGFAVAAILVEHRWAQVLADAARRTGGELRADPLIVDALARGLST
jgi:hypothetical protein